MTDQLKQLKYRWSEMTEEDLILIIFCNNDFNVKKSLEWLSPVTTLPFDLEDAVAKATRAHSCKVTNEMQRWCDYVRLKNVLVDIKQADLIEAIFEQNECSYSYSQDWADYATRRVERFNSLLDTERPESNNFKFQ